MAHLPRYKKAHLPRYKYLFQGIKGPLLALFGRAPSWLGWEEGGGEVGEAGGGVRTTEVGVEGGGVRSTESTESWSPGVATHLGDTVVIIMMMSRIMLIMMIMMFILS